MEVPINTAQASVILEVIVSTAITTLLATVVIHSLTNRAAERKLLHGKVVEVKNGKFGRGFLPTVLQGFLLLLQVFAILALGSIEGAEETIVKKGPVTKIGLLSGAVSSTSASRVPYIKMFDFANVKRAQCITEKRSHSDGSGVVYSFHDLMVNKVTGRKGKDVIRISSASEWQKAKDDNYDIYMESSGCSLTSSASIDIRRDSGWTCESADVYRLTEDGLVFECGGGREGTFYTIIKVEGRNMLVESRHLTVGNPDRMKVLESIKPNGEIDQDKLLSFFGMNRDIEKTSKSIMLVSDEYKYPIFEGKSGNVEWLTIEKSKIPYWTIYATLAVLVCLSILLIVSQVIKSKRVINVDMFSTEYIASLMYGEKMHLGDCAKPLTKTEIGLTDQGKGLHLEVGALGEIDAVPYDGREVHGLGC